MTRKPTVPTPPDGEREPKDTDRYCAECGSWSIWVLEWRHYNTNEWKDEGPGDDCWCPDCELHVTPVTHEEWQGICEDNAPPKGNEP